MRYSPSIYDLKKYFEIDLNTPEILIGRTIRLLWPYTVEKVLKTLAAVDGVTINRGSRRKAERNGADSGTGNESFDQLNSAD